MTTPRYDHEGNEELDVLWPNLKDFDAFRTDEERRAYLAGTERCFWHLVAFAPVWVRLELAERLGLTDEQRKGVGL